MTNNPYKLDWLPEISNHDAERYVAIAEAIAEAIKSGRLKAGQRLPPQRLLAYTLGLNPGTVHKAYRLAMKRGQIVGEVGRGSFVRGNTVASTTWPNENPYDRSIDFCDNYPCPIRMDKSLRKHLAGVGDAPYFGQLLQYQQNSAWRNHKSVACTWIMRYGVEAKEQNVLITSGALHAGFISLLTLCRAGDIILTEEFTSQAIKGAAARLKLRIRGVKMDRNGMIPEHLEELLHKEKFAAAYLVPTLHNPTATVLTLSRRRRVAELLSAHGVPFIEDDIFAPLLDDPRLPISSFAPDLGFYVAGLSKAIAPGLRLAFLKVPDRYYQDALANLRITTWLASPLLMEMASSIISSGDADKIIKEQKIEIDKRQAMARSILAGCDLSTHRNALHLWLKLPEPWRAAEFKDELSKREVLALASDSFAIERGNQMHAMRISLGTPPSATKVMEGLQIIRDTISKNI
jgi:DNA-binding transcriptional MocR family regulator